MTLERIDGDSLPLFMDPASASCSGIQVKSAPVAKILAQSDSNPMSETFTTGCYSNPVNFDSFNDKV